MRRFRPFMQKEQKGLEGRTIDIGNLKVNVRSVMAEGGFSCVYLVCDAVHPSQQYALKHIICNDEESLDLVKKEISVMNLLKGHPNVVSLVAHTVMDMGRTKEAFLVMECCEKTLVNVLESRGAGYFEEKQILLIFRDVCNAVFAMHCLSPPIAHRDLKAENLLLGPDEMWKLCDFGSTSTNHKCFERPEEMGIEEDNIRKHTTPAYRAPEMWDLFRRELINEKVDIWALGCLLYRICYFKSAFDGESKLQVLNGNYRIPESPKYTSSVIDLIKDMLQASPDARPDITQVWFRVNGLLPESLQKSLPDRPADGGISNPARKSTAMPRRSPPPPPSKAPVRSAPELHVTSEASGGPLGAFWSSHHADDLFATQEVETVLDEPRRGSLSKHDIKGSPDNLRHPENGVSQSEQRDRAHRRSSQASSLKKFADGPSEDFKPRFSQEDVNRGSEKAGVSQPEKTLTSQNEAFNTFVADFDTAKLESLYSNNKSVKEQSLEDEVARLKEQLKQIKSEKDEVTSKYEKLSAICHSQGQEIQELKQTLAMKSPSPNRDFLHKQTISIVSQSGTTQQHETIQGTMSELRKGLFNNSSPSPNSDQRKAFSDEPRSCPKSVRTTNFHQSKNASAANPAPDSWGFGTDNFTAVLAASPIEKTPDQGNNSQHKSDSKSMGRKNASQPAGWAGF